MTRLVIKTGAPELRRSSLRLSALVFAFLALIVSHARAQISSAHLSQIDKSDFPSIKLFVDVADNTARGFELLPKSAFKVFEDGKLVEITSFADPSSPW